MEDEILSCAFACFLKHIHAFLCVVSICVSVCVHVCVGVMGLLNESALNSTMHKELSGLCPLELKPVG